jgi:hypothetical protein
MYTKSYKRSIGITHYKEGVMASWSILIHGKLKTLNTLFVYRLLRYFSYGGDASSLQQFSFIDFLHKLSLL